MSKGLYIHIPFCKHICAYCDFPKMVSNNQKLIDEYISKMILEFDNYDYKDVDTIYIGGGTPNVLDIKNLERIFRKINDLNINYKEFSIEVNPELLNIEQINLFKKYGITRISIGAESLDNEILKYLGRHHSKEDIINSINLLRDNGFNNINLDFIYAHPLDTKDKLSKMLDEVIELNVPHLSFYTLILEDKTYFSYKNIKMLDEDLVSDLMDLVNEKLEKYHHYEISNYSFDGYESLHNIHYWSSEEYIGIGMGASGYLDNIRYDNPRTIKEYINNYKREENELTIDDKKSEYFILGLRMLDGVSLSKYQELFNSSVYDDYNLSELLKYELIEINEDILKLTYKGYKLANVVFEVFYEKN